MTAETRWAQADAYYVRLESQPASGGDPDGVSRSVFHPTRHTQGAWRADEQHMAPVGGLVAGELQSHQRREDLRVARLSFEILGTLHAEPFEVSVHHDPAMRGPEAADPYPGISQWPGGYIESLDVSALPEHAPGQGQGWLTNPYPMIEGETTDPMVKLIGMVDTANGVAPALDAGPGGHSFANVDLQIHLHRLPAGEHLGLQTTSNVGPDGVGLTSAVLHDVHGPFGRSEQIQTIRRIPSTP